MSKRDYFAALAMQGLLSNPEIIRKDLPLTIGRLQTLSDHAILAAETVIGDLEASEHAERTTGINPYANEEESED